MLPLQAAARLSPWAMRAMGAGRFGGLLGPKAQNIVPPDVAQEYPTVDFSQSNLGQMLGGVQDWIRKRSQASEPQGFDEAGFTSAPIAPLAQGAAPALPPGINIPSLPVPPASMQPQAIHMPTLPTQQPQMPAGEVGGGGMSAMASGPQGSQGPAGPFGLPSWDPLYNMGHLLGFEKPVSGPDLINKFMQQLHAAGPGVPVPDRHALNGW
jgi:hypothetical protein